MQVIIDVKPSIRIILIIITDFWSNLSDKNNTGIVDVFYIIADPNLARIVCKWIINSMQTIPEVYEIRPPVMVGEWFIAIPQSCLIPVYNSPSNWKTMWILVVRCGTSYSNSSSPLLLEIYVCYRFDLDLTYSFHFYHRFVRNVLGLPQLWSQQQALVGMHCDNWTRRKLRAFLLLLLAIGRCSWGYFYGYKTL